MALLVWEGAVFVDFKVALSKRNELNSLSLFLRDTHPLVLNSNPR
jgi:hypothetical protein